MALIKCPECGKEISDKAVNCIHCGFPLNEINKSNAQLNICLYKNKSYDLSKLVKYLKDYSFPGPGKMTDEMLCRSQEILYEITGTAFCPYDEELIYYIKNNRQVPTPEFIPTQNKNKYVYLDSTPKPDPNIVRCPKCGSTSVTTQERGYSIMWGVLGSTKKKNLCQKCGYTWWPGARK